MPKPTTLITPAENRFFRLSEHARRQTTLNQISRLLNEHVTVKADSDFLPSTVRNLIVHDHGDWLSACSQEWQLLASLPYVVNQSTDRQAWHHCELCHKPVRYEYHVQNKQNHRELIVGSECVKKFMNAETRFLMVITTEDNFYAVAQYQRLTAKAPTVPNIMFTKPLLPQLPSQWQPQVREVQTHTQTTVTTYLRRRTSQLPLTELKPSLTTYDQLVDREKQTIADRIAATKAQVEQAHEQAQQAAQTAAVTAEHALRTSATYRRYLSQLAHVIVRRPDRQVARDEFSKLNAPQTGRALLNAYQFGIIVAEYAQTGQIQVRRLAMLKRDFVADLNQMTQTLDQQQTTRFYDDVFNSCWGWDYHQTSTQLADWQRLLGTRWARQLNLTDFQALAALTSVEAIQQWLSQHAAKALAAALNKRLAAQPEFTPVPRTRLTRRELRTFCDRELAASVTAAALTATFDRYYQLKPSQQALYHETLTYYYVAKQSDADHQAALTQLQWLLKG
ncbi:hypothetical protein [Lactiplantibacillus mudanjiangensis]|uniref:Uncharacterized protein n=1 Tax=Lactiplantibacillus mudanjiangensis TaxID=1296538 RepID=A0A660DTT1_9LACO|nr:hypothetical protein [Lactiplantibacillus mudanjiangensis]VDG22821.1 hypothetical protein [Lactobacillus pentosus] [Lactiplantibacillus mudanjiangensis]VDG26607.1 hypothetical protein [Lactobacillus pentosus] [Lactiplantibacillus mudanjiangensis]